MKGATRAYMLMIRIMMMRRPLKRRGVIEPRRLKRMFLMIRTMITRKFKTPPMIMVYGGLLDSEHKVHLTF